MTAARQVPDPAAVARWLNTLKTERGCLRARPDPADPAAVAAYNQARRQLAAQPSTEAEAEP